MLASSASQQNIQISFLDTDDLSPAKQIIASSSHISGSFTDPAKILQLAESVDVLTVEIEHVDVDALDKALIHKPSLQIHPRPSTIRIIQDKFVQKEFLRAHTLPLSDFVSVQSTESSIKEAAERLGLPLMLKSRTMAYDGRGNFALHSLADISTAIAFLGPDRPLYAEKWVPFVKEVAVMVVRTVDGTVKSYPAVETVHKDNICHIVFAPLRAGPGVSEKVRGVAEGAVKVLEGAGIFGVEMFLMQDGLSTLFPFLHLRV